MRLHPEEETFLRHWMYEETHFREGPGPAKHLQLHHKLKPADLATLIAAAFPELEEQESAGIGPPPSNPPTWPWSERAFPGRLEEARTTLARRQPGNGADPATSRAEAGGENPK